MKPTSCRMAQDLPPTGGYDPIQYKVSKLLPAPSHHLCKSSTPDNHVANDECSTASPLQRNIPARGFRASYYLFAMGIIMTYGIYKSGVGIREKKYVPTFLNLLASMVLGQGWTVDEAGLRGGMEKKTDWLTSNPSSPLLVITVNSPARNSGHGSTSHPYSKRKKTAIRSAGI